MLKIMLWLVIKRCRGEKKKKKRDERKIDTFKRKL